jgi:hypothetical protein
MVCHGRSSSVLALCETKIRGKCSMIGSNNANDGKQDQIVFWHRDLPPLDAESVAEHTV